MRDKCFLTPIPIERKIGPNWLKDMLRANTKLVGTGGIGRVLVHASDDSGPDVACLFMALNTANAHSDAMPRSFDPVAVSPDRSNVWHDAKLKEEFRAKICGMLIDAQEKERAWISRELHDDISQRIALLAVHLGQWDKNVSPSTPEIHEHIHEVSRRLSEISQGIRALSHRLHSSNLDYLGLATAASGFCKELAEKHNVRIDFSQTGIRRNVPKDVSLCLFRVLQEALQNAVKHSGVKQFNVELHGTSDKIQLTVSDSGTGFSPARGASSGGLGLISMRERMHLINGEFQVLTELNRGTTVYASAPLLK